MKYSQALSTDTITVEGDKTVPGFELGYSPSLDGIRGISILVVMAFNAHLPYVEGGYIGVSIFFVLSGFLITSLLVQEYDRTSSISLRNFYYRRALRLLPALFALMLMVSAYAAVLQPREKAITTWKGVLYALFYVANWAQIGEHGVGIGALSHAWSLSVEEQFYILWPLLLIVLLRFGWKRKWIVSLLLVLISASVIWSAWLWSGGSHHLRMYFGSDTRANELLIGCLTALLLHWGVVPSQSREVRNAFRLISFLSAAAIIFMIIKIPVFSGFLYSGGFALIAIGTALIMIDVLIFPSRFSKALEFQPLVWMGKVSYGLYLWHFPIFEALRQKFEGHMNVIAFEVLRFGIVFIVAATSYYLLEKPFLKLKQRFNPAGKR